MSEGKVTVVATFKSKAGKEAEVKEAILGLVAPTRTEAGCINYDLHQSTDDPSLFLLYENWISKQDLDDHLAMPYLEEFLGKADLILSAPVDIALFQMVSDPA